MNTTTLNRIRAVKPCADGWAKLLRGLGKTEADDEPLPLVTILDISGLDDAIWALRCIDDQSQVRRYAVWCARQVQHLMTDPRSLAALSVAERHADGQATDEELAAARAAARAASAASAAKAAAWAAGSVASRAAGVAADVAAGAAPKTASRGAARAAARAAAKAAQEAQFCVMFGGDV